MKLDLKDTMDSRSALTAVLAACVADLRCELEHGPAAGPVLIGNFEKGGPEQASLLLPDILEAVVAGRADDVPHWKLQWLFLTMLFVSKPLRDAVGSGSPGAVQQYYLADYCDRFSTAVAGRIVRHERGSEVVTNASDPLQFTILEYLRVYQTYTRPG
jgi:hypothetical protein